VRHFPGFQIGGVDAEGETIEITSSVGRPWSRYQGALTIYEGMCGLISRPVRASTSAGARPSLRCSSRTFWVL
jgi:hypothetical protein